MPKKVDFLVIGSGIAGLAFALKVAEHGKVCIITKSAKDESNTKYAQGGIAAVLYEPDSYEKHINDTLNAGAGLCNEEIVRMVISQSTDRINDLINWGAKFDRCRSGKYDMHLEGGHSENRVLHHKDKTGYELVNALLKRARLHPNIDILENHFAIEIITQHHLGKEVTRRTPNKECYGAYVLDKHSNKVETLLSKITMIATGGVGNVYSNTTNPSIATGDGIAMVYRAKGEIENMEFVQLHPTTLYNPRERPSFLISEAVRGFGGILRTMDGKKFAHKYDKRGDLAPRDIVARAVDNEMKVRGDEYVYLDCTHIPKVELKKNFPNIYKKCLSIGYDMAKDYIPVTPGAHYMCGGIKVDDRGRSTINQLYASGECSSTGLHGANRLASNSLLEAVVFSHRASEDAIQQVNNISYNDNVPEWDDAGTVFPEEMILITQSLKETQQIMSSYVGIVRSDLRLERALSRLEIIYNEIELLFKKSILSQELCEVRNVINVAYLIIKMSLDRKESIGLHYTVDYPPTKKK